MTQLVASRRLFLGGLLAITACQLSVIKTVNNLTAIPLLHGDGVHDDTAALNALFQGKPFRTADGFAGIAKRATLINAKCFVTDTVFIQDGICKFIDCLIIAHIEDKEKPVLSIKHGAIDESNFKITCYREDETGREPLA